MIQTDQPQSNKIKYLSELAMNIAHRHNCMRHLYASTVAIEAIAISYGGKTRSIRIALLLNVNNV